MYNCLIIIQLKQNLFILIVLKFIPKNKYLFHIKKGTYFVK